MKILDVNVFRDGGTIKITTDSGIFWIPTPFSNDKNIYTGESIFQKETVTKATDDEVAHLFRLLALEASALSDIKRRLRI